MRTVLWKSAVWVAIICVVLAALSILVPTAYEHVGTAWRVPRERDPAIVGTWRAEISDFDDKSTGQFRRYEFQEDGNVQVFYPNGYFHTLEWGTHDGQITFRFFAIDAWVAPRYPYKVTEDRLTILGRTQQRYGRVLRDYTRVRKGSGGS